jgi:hypothetical protein
MSSEHPQELSEPPVRGRPTSEQTSDETSEQMSDDRPNSETAGNRGPSDDAACRETTVLVRGETLVPGETVRDPGTKSSLKDSPPEDKEKSARKRKEVSQAKSKIQSRLPVLDDDPDVGVQKEQTVIRDGKADLAFTGTLLASAAPPSAPRGQWQEYRIYETSGKKYVFSKATRSVFTEEQDTHEAEVFDPSPSSMPSQLLRSARDLAHSRPLTWMDAAVAFFGYDPLAKTLYRKLSGQFEEHIS